MDDRLLEPGTGLADIQVEQSLRPQTFDSFIGQKTLKENLAVYVEAAKRRGEALDHCLFAGPPGLGKTTLSYLVAKAIGSELFTISGPALDKKGDLAAVLTNLKPNDVLFIDEIHRVPIAVEEVLYSAMEDYKLDIILGQGPG
ncbi:MAG: AAA family ATPase, partial [Proteobacteria bacterium]